METEFLRSGIFPRIGMHRGSHWQNYKPETSPLSNSLKHFYFPDYGRVCRGSSTKRAGLRFKAATLRKSH